MRFPEEYLDPCYKINPRKPYRRANGEQPRKLWLDGTWDYARGRKAEEHQRYKDALKLFSKNPKNEPFPEFWIRTWQDVEAVLAGCYFDFSAGDKVCRFFERALRHTMSGLDGQEATRPFILMDWQRWDLLMPIFGWMRPDGTRRFRQALVWVPKKNGKSETCSGLGLYFLTKDIDRSADVLTAAMSRDQAGLIHDEAVKMANMSPLLSQHLKCINHSKTILYPEKMGRFRALAYESGKKIGVQEGRNWSALLFDEVHIQTDLAYFQSLCYGGVSRAQSVLIEISTAGVYDPTALGWQEFSRMLKIHNGEVVNWEVFTYYAHADYEDQDGEPIEVDICDPAQHIKANPSIDITIKSEDLMSQAKSASDNPHEYGSFRRYRLNLWTNAKERLINLNKWKSCATSLDRDAFREALKGKACFGGTDLSQSNDLTAFALWFPPDDMEERAIKAFDESDPDESVQMPVGDPVKLCVWFWLPEDNIQDLERANSAPYIQWANDGWLRLTSGSSVDYEEVERDILQIMADYNLQSIGFDPWCADPIMLKFCAKYGEDFAYKLPQSCQRMAAPTKYFLELISTAKIHHENNPILNWHVSNAPCYTKNGFKFVRKDERGVRFKVDGVVASIIAGQRAMCKPEKKKSVYEQRGLIKL